MTIQKTLGGDRLGSGNQMKIAMHNYYRSTHNLSTVRKTTMAPGILYPIYSQIAMNGDVFEIGMDASVRTLPTQAPLFGSFKLQVDAFSIPIRLYQGILHNNPINIGMKMNQIKLPKLEIDFKYETPSNLNSIKHISPTSLLKYIGLSGIGVPNKWGASGNSIKRKINAVPILAYYDIFKNYYANKQEDDAYIIGNENAYIPIGSTITTLSANSNGQNFPFTAQDNGYTWVSQNTLVSNQVVRCFITTQKPEKNTSIFLTVIESGKEYFLGSLYDLWYEYAMIDTGSGYGNGNAPTDINGTYAFNLQISFSLLNNIDPSFPENAGSIKIKWSTKKKVQSSFGLQSFPLQDIDRMREKLLGKTQLGDEYVINSEEGLMPYAMLARPSGYTTSATTKTPIGNALPLYGLCLKTYQSDIFNNWVKNELVEGSNGIAEITAVNTSDGSFTIDALNLAQKVYNMLNRIAASGGTYEDWQEVVYTSSVLKKAETPIYCGGMSSEVVFEEIISTSATESSPLGTLGGKGKQIGKKGGKITIKVNEPSYIMIIASLTPRIDYSQGNQFDLTEIDTIDDLHKPALDGIGYQDLLGEQMAWWDTEIDSQKGTLTRSKVGKSVAWINYMTDVDKVYGEFVAGEGQSYMVLNRNYTAISSGSGENLKIKVKDFTTYIEPKKFNYAFADANLDAQNFWGAFRFDIKARRVMSAKQIPNI